MTGPDPAVAATRLAVRRDLAAADPGSGPVLVACSGGADSLALLAAAVFEARERPWAVVGVTVDHAWHEASADVTTRVVGQMAALGADETASIRVSVEADGHGLEAAARQARYAVLEEIAERFGSTTVLLGHTRDDQAETVLHRPDPGERWPLAGRDAAGARHVPAPAPRPDPRADGAGVPGAGDRPGGPTRPTRTRASPGPGSATWCCRRWSPSSGRESAPRWRGPRTSCARTSSSSTTSPWRRTTPSTRPSPSPGCWRCPRRYGPGCSAWLRVRAGARDAELFHAHVLALDALLTDWHGQGAVDLPGHVRGVAGRDAGVRAD